MWAPVTEDVFKDKAVWEVQGKNVKPREEGKKKKHNKHLAFSSGDFVSAIPLPLCLALYIHIWWESSSAQGGVESTWAGKGVEDRKHSAYFYSLETDLAADIMT